MKGEQSKKYFMKSNLPTPVLGLIWTLSDLDKDGRMTLQEFTIAMHLIECKLKGSDVPKMLPVSLKNSASASYHGFPSSSGPMQPNTGMLTPMNSGLSTPIGNHMMMNGATGGMSAAQPLGMFSMSGMPQSGMMMQPSMPMNQPMGFQPMMNMNFSAGFNASPGQINRMGSVPTGSNFSQPMPSTGQSFTLPARSGQQFNQSSQSVFSGNVSGALKSNASSLDSLAIDTLSGFKAASTTTGNFGKPGMPPVSIGTISAPNRLRYTQMFKAADHQATGYLSGENARQILIQSNVDPALLAKIWELADVNKDGQLELDEFIIALHLIDSVRLGITLPNTLPSELIPPQLRMAASGDIDGKLRSGSVGSIGDALNLPAGTFEDKRKQNWDKGQMELQRRRREIQEKEMKAKEERERKQREIEEQKRLRREETERQRQQQLENERRQKEEMEKEQELLRKKMIEQRLAAQLEVEKQRQREWEKRRKEELMNQKEHEENIVNELKSRLDKLKIELSTHTSSRDALSASYEKKKTEGLELHAAIEMLNQSRETRMNDISRLQSELRESQVKLKTLIGEREKFTLELNQKDSTHTSEALGAIRSSVKQMKLGMVKLKKNLVSIEAETASVLKDANKINEQHNEIKQRLQGTLSENTQLKQQCEMKKRAEFERRKLAEANRQQMEFEKRKQMELREKLEADLKKQLEHEQEAMRKEKQIQEVSQKQRQEARNTEIMRQRNLAKQQAEAVLKKQDEIVQKQQNALVATTKTAPPRPRTRPQGSPVKEPLSLFKADFSNQSNDSTQNKSSISFEADFSAFDSELSQPSSTTESLFDIDLSQPKSKKPPPRPAAPAVAKPAISNKPELVDSKKAQKEEEKKQKEDEKKRKKEEEVKKKAEEAERKRLEKEKEEIERLKREQEDNERKLAEKRRKEDGERLQREEQEQERIAAEKEKEDEKKRKDEEVKRKVREMQMKRLEKKQTTTPKAAPERPTAAPTTVEQYVVKQPYKTIFAFEARNPDELTLAEGDIVQVDENHNAPPGWFYGSSNGSSGLFPANYASKLQNQNFSDYVDLDPRANIFQQETQQQPKPQPQKRKTSESSQKKETKAEPLPKLRPVKKTDTKEKTGGSRPKSAILPTGKLKPLQPVEKSLKQRKTSDHSDLFPSYDYVVGPASAKPAVDDVYAVPTKSKSMDNIAEPETIAESPFQEDLYQVPGEIVPAYVGEIIQAMALYPYRGTKDDHLSFDKNDYINVQQQQDQWWYGECKGLSGWFPKSYVKPVGAGTSRTSSQSGDSSVGQPAEDVNTTDASQQPVDGFIALFDYEGQDGDLSFHEGDVISVTKKEGEWWEGYVNGQSGMFPSNYVQKKEPEIIINKKPELAQVITKYTAVGENEISLNAGQLVHVLQKNSNGWWQGELQVRGKNKPNGWFPASHVKLKEKSKQEATPAAPSATPDSYSGQEDIYSVPVKRKDQQEQVLAMFSYTAQNQDELTFYKGSVINVISKEGDWWKGEFNGLIGVFPFNYVQVLRSDMQETTSQWSGAFDSMLLKSMSKTERQRQNHIYELINTEQNYMDDLSLTLEVFYNPLAESNTLSEQELHTVFINWKELIMCNMKFLKALLVRKKMSQTDKIEGVGDIIVEQIPRFSPYIRFCSCMLNACRLLQEKVEKDAEFKQFEKMSGPKNEYLSFEEEKDVFPKVLKKCAGDPRLKQNLPLSSYLLKPLQRITKYPLVITNILKYTPEDHFDRENLVIGLEKAEDLCSQVNEGVRSQESSNRLEWLQERVNLEGLEEKLVFNSQTNCLGQRKYLYHGTLHKHKSNKELKAFLFNDFLLLCRFHIGHSIAGIFHPDNDTKFTIYKKPIFLNEVIVKQPTDPEVNDNLFHLSHIDRVYSFRAETKTVRNNWVSLMQKASQHFIETERDKRNRASRARSLCDVEVGRLVVTIIEGADLPASDPTGTSDPYCEVSMGSQEHRTKVIQKDLNPKWNSTMIFNVKDIDQDVLCITVFDRDFFSPNDFLGRTEVSISSLLGQKGPVTKRLLLHEVATGEIVVTLELQNVKFL